LPYAVGRRDVVSIDPAAVPLGVVLFVADDHADHVEALRVAGYHVEIAPNALEALQRGRSLRPDALIVPLALPGTDGPDLADRIGSAGPRAHTLAVVILVPDHGGEPRAAGALTAGAVFCNLPCHPSELVATVGEQLAARRLLGG
jgi:DNA-binding response OmpR family regulator